jgi:hypothetical protein
MSKMGSHCPFGHLKHKLWPKERSGVKLAIWLPTTKSRESTRFPCVKATCHIPLESSWQGLQLCFRPHCNWRSAQEVMRPQSCRSPGCCNWESWDKMSFGCDPHGEAQSILKGEGGGFPQVHVVVSLVCLGYPWLVLAPKVLQLCINHFVLVLCRSVWVSELVTSSYSHPGAPTCPYTLL